MGIFGKDDQEQPAPATKAQPASSLQPESSVPTGFVAPRYVVAKGDSLSRIAERAYGDGSKWRKIYEANKDIIKDPDLIYPGQALRIPD